MIPSHLQQYDYRPNLIVDQNNPILIQKAGRDRFSSPSHWRSGYGGEAYLGRKNSEDALTWNVFRSLQRDKKGLEIISRVFNVAKVEAILFWGMDPENHGEEQQLTNIMIRTIDGKHRGTMTEPDLVVFTDKEVCFIECKLNQNGNTSPWKTQSTGSEKRMKTYVEKFPELKSIIDWRTVYQMIRQYVYAKSIAEILDKSPCVFPLVNEKHFDIISNHYEILQKSSLGMNIFKPIVTWQNIIHKLEKTQIQNKRVLSDKLAEALNASR